MHNETQGIVCFGDGSHRLVENSEGYLVLAVTELKILENDLKTAALVEPGQAVIEQL